MYRYAAIYRNADGTVALVCSFLTATFDKPTISGDIAANWPAGGTGSCQCTGKTGDADVNFAAPPA